MKIKKFRAVWIMFTAALLLGAFLFTSKIIDTVHNEHEFGDDAIHMKAPSLTACGDAFLFYNKEEALLIDTGEAVDQDSLISAIDKAGVKAIDVLILTHFDKDHIGGAPALLEKYPVKICYTSVGDEDSPEYEALEKSLEESATRQVPLTETVRFECMGASFTIYPPTGLAFDKDEDNNLSLITSMQYGSGSLLFAGDARKERLEQFYEKQYDGTAYHFLKVPHHGRDKKNMEGMLDYFVPRAAVITSSRKEPEKDSLVDLLEDRDVDVFLTRQGSLEMTLDQNHIHIRQKNKVFDIDTGEKDSSLTELADKEESPVVINEMGNDGSKKGSWAELYNSSDQDISLKNAFLTDKKNKLFRYGFPEDAVIKAGGFYLADLDTFTISPSETLYLVGDGRILDEFEMPLWVRKEISCGRMEDGGKKGKALTPTPGETNENAHEVRLVEAPSFSHESGFYDKSFKLIIKAQEGSRIFYTTDGSDPDENSTEYKKKISIKKIIAKESRYSIRKDFAPYYYGYTSDSKPRVEDKEGDWYCRYRLPEGEVDKCAVVKAAAIDEEGNRSDVTTATYFIRYQEKEAYKGIPILSIVADPDDLFGSEKGIMVNGSRYDAMLLSDNAQRLTNPYISRQYCNSFRGRGREWERAIHMDYFSPEDGHLLFSQEAGIRLHGNTSRVNGARKSFNLYARKEYDGHNVFQASFFDTGLLSDKVTLMKGDDVRNYYFSKKMWTDSIPSQDYSMIQLFLDGEYWGLYAIQERYVSDEYMHTHFNLDKEDYSLAKGTSTGFDIKNGDPDVVKTSFRDVRDFAWNKDLTKDKNYDKLCRMMDMDSYIRAYAGRIYTGDQDWSYFKNQIMLYSDYQWHWLIYDMDSGAGDRAISMVDVNTFTSPRLIKRYSLENDELFPYLMKSPRFRARFCAVFMDLANEVFHPDRVKEEMDEFKKKYGTAGMIDNLRYPQDGDIPGQITASSSELTRTCDTITQYFHDRYQIAPAYMADYFQLKGKAAKVTLCIEDRNMGGVIINTIKPELLTTAHEEESADGEEIGGDQKAEKNTYGKQTGDKRDKKTVGSQTGQPADKKESDAGGPGEWTGSYYTDYPVTLRAVPEEGFRFIRWELEEGQGSFSDENKDETELTFKGDIRVKAVFEKE